jgi:hypothetical protein
MSVIVDQGAEKKKADMGRIRKALTSPSLPRLPKVIWLVGCCRLDGGRPPLAEGWGMGAGE